MDMMLVVTVGTRSQHGRESGAGGFPQEFAQPAIGTSVGQLQSSAIREDEGGHIERLAAGVLAELAPRLTVAGAAFERGRN